MHCHGAEQARFEEEEEEKEEEEEEEEEEGSRGAYVCLSANVFLGSGYRRCRRQKKEKREGRKKMWSISFLFRKHSYNFKYNNFLFGKTLGIMPVCLALIYPVFSFFSL